MRNVVGIGILAVLGLAFPVLAVDPPCEPVETIFFDLGDTLLEPGSGGLFVERPGVQTMIDDLQVLGIRLGIITNTPGGWTLADLQAAMANPSFLNEFEVVLLSSEATAPPKPDPAIFLEAHGLLASAPPLIRTAFVTEALGHIADLENNPTEGARAAGMVGIQLISGAPSPLTEYTVHPDQMDDVVTVVESGWVFCDGFEGGDTSAWSQTAP